MRLVLDRCLRELRRGLRRADVPRGPGPRNRALLLYPDRADRARHRPKLGAAAGPTAAALYALATFVNPELPSLDVLTVSTPIRLFTFATSGALIGWYAQRNRELIKRLEVLAQRDRLTGLPNVRAFEEAVDKLFKEERPFGLLLGDMDGLREANEELGHGGGDVVLVRLAETLGKLLGPEERLARVGGDEFAILTTTRSKDAAADRGRTSSSRSWPTRGCASRSAGPRSRARARTRSGSSASPTSGSTRASWSAVAGTASRRCRRSASLRVRESA